MLPQTNNPKKVPPLNQTTKNIEKVGHASK